MAAASPAWQDSPFLKACRREHAGVTPIWIMRQAGRYMKEYRAIRARVPFATLCKRPDLAAEVAVTAVQKTGVDAAILFSDILLILVPMGFRLEYVHGEGPVIHNPVRTPADLKRLREVHPASMGFVYRAVAATRSALPGNLPLIGFSGAPFTLASYAIEGGASRNFQKTKAFMHRHPGAWKDLLALIARAVSGYLNAQAEAGAQALQLFDSWVGCLSPADYRAFVLPHSRAVIRSLNKRVPVIHFGTGTAGFLEDFKAAGGDVIGLDPGVDLGRAWKRLGRTAVMGNLDPCVLLADRSAIRRQARRILAEAGGRPGHVFNLGHGVLPATPVGHVKALVDFVHEATS